MGGMRLSEIMNIVQGKLDILNTWLYPKDIESAVKFIEKKSAWVSDIIIYGGGTHTIALLNNLSEGAKSKIRLIIDRFPEGKKFSKIPVAHPMELKNNKVNFDVIILSHYDFENSMVAYLKEIGIYAKEKVLPIYTNPEYRSIVEGKYKWIDDIEFKKEGRTTVVFISLEERKILNNDGMRLLRERGDYRLIHLNMSRDYTPAKDIFDYEFDCKRSVYVLIRFVEKIMPDVIYIHDSMTTLYFLPGLLKKMYPDIKIIWEPYDLLKLCMDDYYLLQKSIFSSEGELKYIEEAEKYNLESIDGIVYKEVGELAREVYHSKRNKPSLYFHQYLSKKNMSFYKTKYEPPYRLVYAGSIIPSGGTDPFTADNYLKDEFEMILRQGLHVDVYLNANEDVIKTMYQDYLSLADDYETFKIFPRLEIEKLIDVISKKYHFGFHIIHYNGEIFEMNKKRFETTFSSKLWTYIFAGLPVIVAEECKGMADFVAEHGIGLSIPYKKQNVIIDILKEISPADYCKMKDNISAMCSKYSLENMINKMGDFIKLVKDGKSSGDIDNVS